MGPNLRWQQTLVKRRRKKRLCRKVNEIREFSRVGWSSHFDRLCSGFLSLLPPKALSACLTASAQPCNGALCSSVTYWHKTSFLNMKFSFAVSLTKRHDAWLDTCCLVTTSRMSKKIKTSLEWAARHYFNSCAFLTLIPCRGAYYIAAEWVKFFPPLSPRNWFRLSARLIRLNNNNNIDVCMASQTDLTEMKLNDKITNNIMYT